MDSIPVFVDQTPAQRPITAPFPIEKFLELEYSNELDDLRSAYENAPIRLEIARKAGREIYHATYQKLTSSFIKAFHDGQSSIVITIEHVQSLITNYGSRKIADINQYQRLAIEQFASDLREKKFPVVYGEHSDYWPTRDKDDYYDYCDSYYNVTVKIR